jgi:hypothetical protein
VGCVFDYRIIDTTLVTFIGNTRYKTQKVRLKNTPNVNQMDRNKRCKQDQDYVLLARQELAQAGPHHAAPPADPIRIYEFFDSFTCNGNVYKANVSSSTDATKSGLTNLERNERMAYEATIQILILHYDVQPHPICRTKEQVLQQRICAPCLPFQNVNDRAARLDCTYGRLYPAKVHEWMQFPSHVKTYNLNDDSTQLPRLMQQNFSELLRKANRNCSDRAEEQVWLLECLRDTLVNAGIVRKLGEYLFEGIGNADFYVMNDLNVATIVCNVKGTTNLLLLMLACECVAKYNAAYQLISQRCSLEWANIVHPISHLVSYMVENKKRYGALTSATRTYFIYLNNISDSNECQVHISDAWFVGQENYLRAWAYMHHLGGSDTTRWVSPPIDWILSMTDTNSTRTFKDKCHVKNGNNGKGRARPKYPSVIHCPNNTCLQDMLPHVPLDDIEIVKVLGLGPNGVCYKVRWKGTEYAMKQFDLGRMGEKMFCREMEAYMVLKKAWGDLVPRPIFLSMSHTGWVIFLGLQLGRTFTELDDYRFEYNSKTILQRLQTEYHIQHNDVNDHNMIILTD